MLVPEKQSLIHELDATLLSSASMPSAQIHKVSTNVTEIWSTFAKTFGVELKSAWMLVLVDKTNI